MHAVHRFGRDLQLIVTDHLMAEPLGAGPQTSSSLVSLAAELHLRLREQRPSTPFARLLHGHGSAHDASVFPRGARNSRLVLAEFERGRADQAATEVGSMSGVHLEAQGETQLVALVPEFPAKPEQRNAALLAQRIRRRRPDSVIGISSVIDSISELPQALAEAQHALRLADRTRERVVHADESWLDVSLSRLHSSLSFCLPLHNPLRALQQYDEVQGTQLLHTVRVWLQHNSDSASAAKALHVHTNSLRYRLRRATEISGLRLDDARTRALVQLLLDQ